MGNAFDFHSFPTLPDLFVSFPAFCCTFRTLVFVSSEMSPFFYLFNLLTDHSQMLNSIALYQTGSMSEHQYNQLLQAMLMFGSSMAKSAPSHPSIDFSWPPHPRLT